MLDLSGGDAAALTETRTALELIATQDDPDLDVRPCELARHRDDLTDRNTHIPPYLPAVWATLGHPTRAEALARSITDPDRQASALTAVVQALAQAGQPSRPPWWRPRPRAWPARSPTRTGRQQP